MVKSAFFKTWVGPLFSASFETREIATKVEESQSISRGRGHQSSFGLVLPSDLHSRRDDSRGRMLCFFDYHSPFSVVT